MAKKFPPLKRNELQRNYMLLQLKGVIGMPCAIAVPIRQQIIEQRQQGASIAQIAQDLQRSYWSIRTIVRRYRDQGEAGLIPQYQNCGVKGIHFSKRVYRGALWLKRHHPSWGAGFIRVLLQERWSEQAMPSERTLQRWFKQNGLSQQRARGIVSAARTAASAVHQVWQLDGTSHQRLADGSGASWITIVDEASGAHLASVAFPPLRV
jgi:transposase